MSFEGRGKGPFDFDASKLPQINIPKFTMGFKSPLDHAKALVYTDLVFPTHRGFSVSVDMAARIHNTESNPFGVDPDDPRLASDSR